MWALVGRYLHPKKNPMPSGVKAKLLTMTSGGCPSAGAAPLQSHRLMARILAAGHRHVQPAGTLAVPDRTVTSRDRCPTRVRS